MIAFLEGILAHKEPTHALLNVGGVGYQVRISLSTYERLGIPGERLHLITWLHVKEDAHTLYGFWSADERDLFLHLISVSGVGPGTALVVLSSMNVGEIESAIARGDSATLQRIKGLGPKTAQRLVLELKDKIGRVAEGSTRSSSSSLGRAVESGVSSASSYNTASQEALMALVALGIAKPAAEKALEAVIRREGEGLSVELLIKKALQTT